MCRCTPQHHNTTRLVRGLVALPLLPIGAPQLRGLIQSGQHRDVAAAVGGAEAAGVQGINLERGGGGGGAGPGKGRVCGRRGQEPAQLRAGAARMQCHANALEMRLQLGSSPTGPTLDLCGRMFQYQPLAAASAASDSTADSIGSSSTCRQREWGRSRGAGQSWLGLAAGSRGRAYAEAATRGMAQEGRGCCMPFIQQLGVAPAPAAPRCAVGPSPPP